LVSGNNRKFSQYVEAYKKCRISSSGYG